MFSQYASPANQRLAGQPMMPRQKQADPAIADQIEKDAADDTCDGQHTKLLNLGIVEHHRNAADDRPNYEQERVNHRQRSKQADNKENNEGHGCVNADID